jgi:hypothetical protein
VNDPGQFLRHYYHFVAELLLGAWAFWSGSFSTVTSNKDIMPPPIHRIIFAKAKADEWRDTPGFNAYFFRAAFPSTTVEHEDDWEDRELVLSSSLLTFRIRFQFRRSRNYTTTFSIQLLKSGPKSRHMGPI